MPLPTPLINAPDLLAMLGRSATWPVVLDCSFDLTDTQAGEKAHAQGHLPGARYAHLDRDLSGPKTERGSIDGGRHPLPTREAFAAKLSAWGIGPDTPVVAYDAQGGPYAARAWWLLRWLGHTNVTVLDGGLAAWQAAGGPIDREPSRFESTPSYPVLAPAMPTVSADDLLRQPGAAVVIDARAPERFRGDVEPLDAQAGHIPGARNRFFKDNLDATGRFKTAGELRSVFSAFGVPAERIVHQCGSGVTAAHNLLAMEIAGLRGAALYPGSWSEWSADPTRPVAKG